MKVRFLSIGRDRSGLFEPAVQEYASRLQHYCRLELIELPEAHKSKNTQSAIDQEGETILKRIKAQEVLVALDERGRALNSRAFAEFLGKQEAQGREVVFCVGGAEGLSEAVRKRAQLLLSLSAMTLPHRMARLLAMEQIYRGLTILRGEPYHR